MKEGPSWLGNIAMKEGDIRRPNRVPARLAIEPNDTDTL